MGRQKEEIARLEELYAFAQEIAIKSGAIRECQYHEGTYIDQGDVEAENNAYAIGESEIKSGEVSFDRKELMDSIKEAISDAGEECYSCAKWEND